MYGIYIFLSQAELPLASAEEMIAKKHKTKV